QLAFFESAARVAHTEQRAIEKSREPTFAELRHIWSIPHQQFSLFTRAWQRVARMPTESLGAYRTATGVFLSPPEVVATFYRGGGMKSGGPGAPSVGEDVRVPKWVFYPTLIRMPVRIHTVESPHPPKGAQHDVTRKFTVEVFARGSVHEI